MGTLTAILNAANPGVQADAVTNDENLTFKVYNDVDGYVTPQVFGSHISDSNVSVSAGIVTLLNVTEAGISSFKISSVDQAGNESILSDAAGSGYTIDIRRATSEGINVPVTLAVGSNVKLNIHQWKETTTGKFGLGNGISSSVNGFFGLKTQYVGTSTHLSIRDSVAAYYVLGAGYGDGLPHSYEVVFNSATEIEVFLDGVSIGTQAISSFDFAQTTYLVVGAYNSAGALGVNVEIDSFEINGEVFPCNEGTGTTVTGDLGTVANFINTPLWVAK